MKRKTVSTTNSHQKQSFLRGMIDGLPIGLGYFAVSFSLGICAKEAGLTAVQGFFASLFTNASAGEYAVFVLIAANAAYFEVALITLISNARYLLMSCALSQKLSPKTSLIDRLLIGFVVTDELFGIAIASDGYLQPKYYYGAMLTAMPFWAGGTALGIIAGEILPLRVVSAFSVALYGMFLAIIIPPSRKSKRVLLLVASSFAASYAFSVIPGVCEISEGIRTIILTVVISLVGAIVFPVKQDNEKEEASNAA